MGSGASNLTAAQKAELTKSIQALYEKCTSDGLDDDIIQETLTNEFNRMLKVINTPKPAPQVGLSAKMAAKSNVSAKGGLSAKDNKPAKVTRRKSFDSSRVNAGGKKGLLQLDQSEISAMMMLSSQSEAEIKIPEESAVDCWDSVTQQPFCDVCQMAFKSAAFLDRHVKYSDLHVKNVERKERGGKAAEDLSAKLLKAASIDEERLASEAAELAKLLAEPQTEGKHYKLMYSGSKFFWRTQKNIDVDIYHHILPHVLEVISFDPVKHKEATRLYLNFGIIQDLLAQVVSTDFTEKLKELTQDRFFTLTDEAALRESILVQRVSTYILQRLQLDSSGTHGELLYAPLSGDAEQKPPLLAEPPSNLVPVSLTRRRRTSTEEIEATINSINLDREHIGAHINRAADLTKSPGKQLTKVAAAERVSNAVYTAVQYMTSKKWYNDVSAPKRRFIRAARRVIRMNLVAKTKAVLNGKAKPSMPSLSLKTSSMSRKHSVRAREV
jgi:hypothetical protein